MNKSLAMTPDHQNKNWVIKTWQWYFLLVILSVSVSFAFQKMIMTHNAYYSIYGNQMEDYRIDDIIKFIDKLQIWGYLGTPFLILLRLTFVTFLLQLPFLIKDVEISFSEIFRVVTLAFLVIILSDIARFFYLYSLPLHSLTAESLSFVPLAITNLLNKNNYTDIAILFLSKINLFEFFWGYIVYRGLYTTGKASKIDSALVVLGVWSGILMLTIGVIFLQRMLL